MATLLIRPHTHPRDARDAFITIVTLLLIASASLLVAYVLLHSVLSAFAAATAALVFVAALVTGVGLFTVTALEVDATGIRFRRLIGQPRFLPWEKVTGIRRAERAEVVLRGWLLPPIPPRGAALTLTSLGHYRFDWDGGSCYFPPADENALLEIVERNWGGVL
ncbi:MAG TPA: hypothetical protein VMN78_09910 [Longimicrobiales bacterium]|nr:hypothetical protein [Longimicrobiales bacterium]